MALSAGSWVLGSWGFGVSALCVLILGIGSWVFDAWCRVLVAWRLVRVLGSGAGAGCSRPKTPTLNTKNPAPGAQAPRPSTQNLRP